MSSSVANSPQPAGIASPAGTEASPMHGVALTPSHSAAATVGVVVPAAPLADIHTHDEDDDSEKQISALLPPSPVRASVRSGMADLSTMPSSASASAQQQQRGKHQQNDDDSADDNGPATSSSKNHGGGTDNDSLPPSSKSSPHQQQQQRRDAEEDDTNEMSAHSGNLDAGNTQDVVIYDLDRTAIAPPPQGSASAASSSAIRGGSSSSPGAAPGSVSPMPPSTAAAAMTPQSAQHLSKLFVGNVRFEMGPEAVRWILLKATGIDVPQHHVVVHVKGHQQIAQQMLFHQQQVQQHFQMMQHQSTSSGPSSVAVAGGDSPVPRSPQPPLANGAHHSSHRCTTGCYSVFVTPHEADVLVSYTNRLFCNAHKLFVAGSKEVMNDMLQSGKILDIDDRGKLRGPKHSMVIEFAKKKQGGKSPVPLAGGKMPMMPMMMGGGGAGGQMQPVVVALGAELEIPLPGAAGSGGDNSFAGTSQQQQQQQHGAGNGSFGSFAAVVEQQEQQMQQQRGGQRNMNGYSPMPYSGNNRNNINGGGRFNNNGNGNNNRMLQQQLSFPSPAPGMLQYSNSGGGFGGGGRGGMRNNNANSGNEFPPQLTRQLQQQSSGTFRANPSNGSFQMQTPGGNSFAHSGANTYQHHHHNPYAHQGAAPAAMMMSNSGNFSNNNNTGSPVPPLTTPSSSAASPFASAAAAAAAGGPPQVHQVNANVAFCMMPPALAATAERQNSHSPTGSPGTGMRGGASSSSPGGMMHSASSSEQHQQQMFTGGSSVPPSPMPTSVAAAAAAVYMHDPVQLFLGGLCYEYRPEHVAWILSCGLYCDRVPLYYINPSQVTMFVPPNQQNQNMASHAAMMSPGGAMMYGMNSGGNGNGNALNSKGRKGGNAGCAIVTVERDVHLALVQNLSKRILCTKHGCFVGATPHAVEHYKTMNAGELKNGPKHAVVIELRRDTSTSNPSGVHPMYHRSQAHAFGSAPGTAVMDGAGEQQQQSFAGQQQFHDGSSASSHFQQHQQQQHSMMSMPMGGGNMFGAFGGAQPPHSTFHDASGAAASSQQQQYGYGASNNNGGANLLGGSDPIFGQAQANSGYRNSGGGRGKY